jgi:hypothetical protein
MASFLEKLNELDIIYFKNLLPSIQGKYVKRGTIIKIILNKSLIINSLKISVDAGATVYYNEIFMLKSKGYNELNIHVLQIIKKHYLSEMIINHTDTVFLDINLFNFEKINKLINFFEKNSSDWNIEWITKWSLFNSLKNDTDFMIQIYSKEIKDDNIMLFLIEFEKNFNKFIIRSNK